MATPVERASRLVAKKSLGKTFEKYEVYYAKNPRFGDQLLLGPFQTTYVKLADVMATSPEEVYMKMQVDNWNPNGEAVDIIGDLGLSHISMSIGDVVRTPNGEYLILTGSGFHLFSPMGLKR